MDKAGINYWKQVWENKLDIPEFDINYYTNSLLHNLFSRYLEYDERKSILEIGCAFSQYLPYFNKYFGYKINGFDYDLKAVKRTKEIYKNKGIEADIYYKNFFDFEKCIKYDIVISWGFFEHFDNLDKNIEHIKSYLKNNGIVITIIPNMNGLVGLFQKICNIEVYNIHIPYSKEDILNAHKNAGFNTLFCDYYGLWQMGVVNCNNSKFLRYHKYLNIPGKIFYLLSRKLNINLNSKYWSPYIIYIGEKT